MDSRIPTAAPFRLLDWRLRCMLAELQLARGQAAAAWKALEALAGSSSLKTLVAVDRSADRVVIRLTSQLLFDEGQARDDLGGVFADEAAPPGRARRSALDPHHAKVAL